ncbi:MAG: slipin family protein [Gordonibacter pamelaeae]
MRVAPQWERVAILRFGQFNRIAGPGLYCCIPFAEYAAIHVDQRITTASFSAEAALTADLVPVDVDAILFWMVWDAEKACLEVENYPKAVLRSAQTAMRDVIGQLNLADISRMRRKQIDRDLEDILGKKCEQWGVTVISVEIRDIMIPKELQDALSKEAQAERERNARIILAEVEKDISEMFVEAAEVYDRNPRAMKLRAMNLAYEGAKDSKGVLLAPSALADGFNIGQAGGRRLGRTASGHLPQRRVSVWASRASGFDGHAIDIVMPSASRIRSALSKAMPSASPISKLVISRRETCAASARLAWERPSCKRLFRTAWPRRRGSPMT